MNDDNKHQGEIFGAGDLMGATVQFSSTYESYQPTEFSIAIFVPDGQAEPLFALSFLEHKIVPKLDTEIRGVTVQKRVSSTVVIDQTFFRNLTAAGNQLLASLGKQSAPNGDK